MDKTKLKKRIQNFATNVGMATAMLSLGLTYLPIVIQGEGFWGLFVCDVICFCGDLFFAIKDWKEIKKLLEESE